MHQKNDKIELTETRLNTLEQTGTYVETVFIAGIMLILS